MKKTSKKLMTLTMVIITVISLFTVPCGAANVGDVIGYAQPTDIVATINGYQLESYNVNGLTYICVEDLRYYGFNVTFDMNTKTLAFSRSSEPTTIDPQHTNPDFYAIGTNQGFKNILYTDIVTYANNEYVASSNINGKTIVNFNELSRFGSVAYDNDKREISLVIENVNRNDIAELASLLHDNSKYNSDWVVHYRAKGDILMIIGTSREYMNESQRNNFINIVIPKDKEDGEQLLSTLEDIDYYPSALYVEYKNSDGTIITSYTIN